MKKHENCNLPLIDSADLYFDEIRNVIESADYYFDEVKNAWFPVPAFWVGDFVESHSHQIKSR